MSNKTHTVELRGVKHAKFASEETECFEATVYINGKKEGLVRNDGKGGSNFYHPIQLQDKLDKIAKTLPPLPPDELFPKGLEQDADILIGELLSDHLEAKQLKRLCKTKTLFRIKSETYKRGEWRTLAAPFSLKIQAYLEKKYGADLGEIYGQPLRILNETEIEIDGRKITVTETEPPPKGSVQVFVEQADKLVRDARITEGLV